MEFLQGLEYEGSSTVGRTGESGEGRAGRRGSLYFPFYQYLVMSQSRLEPLERQSQFCLATSMGTHLISSD